jgi:hypothetical protein
LLSRALRNPAIIGPPDPAVIDIIPPPSRPPRTTAEEGVIKATVTNVGEEVEKDEEVEEVVEEVVIEEVVIEEPPTEAMVKVGVMDEVEPIDEVVVHVVPIYATVIKIGAKSDFELTIVTDHVVM